MFGLFNKRKHQQAPAVQGWMKLGKYCNRMQRRAADRLNRKAAGLSVKTLAIVVLLFCASIGACSVYLILQALSTPEKSAVHTFPLNNKQTK